MDRYRAIVARIDASDAQKDEIIHIVFGMMRHFTDTAFGLTNPPSWDNLPAMHSPELAKCGSLTYKLDASALCQVSDTAEQDLTTTGTDNGEHHPQKGDHLLPR